MVAEHQPKEKMRHVYIVLVILNLIGCDNNGHLKETSEDFKNVYFSKFYCIPNKAFNLNETIKFEDSIGSKLILFAGRDSIKAIDERFVDFSTFKLIDNYDKSFEKSLLYLIEDTINKIHIYHYYDFDNPDSSVCFGRLRVFTMLGIPDTLVTKEIRYEYCCNLKYIQYKWAERISSFSNLYQIDSNISYLKDIKDEYLDNLPFYNFKYSLPEPFDSVNIVLRTYHFDQSETLEKHSYMHSAKSGSIFLDFDCYRGDHDALQLWQKKW